MGCCFRNPPNQFSFTAIDEIFNGTNYEAGQASAYAFLEFLSELKTNICITPTHFPKMTDLADKNPGKFANYMVPIARDEKGGIIRPFKLTHGVNKEIITFEMMKEISGSSPFVQRAQQMFEEFRKEKSLPS